uniref:Uncharacterized protein n=2 Tax=Moniliophthora roreri TaxID=221103 RepID=A0A0W0EUM2_MONRR
MEKHIIPPSSAVEITMQTNTPLSHTDRIVYQRELSAIEIRLASIRHEIYEAEEKIRALREEETRLTGYAQSYKTVLHPIRGIPEDILRLIFLACVLDSKRSTNSLDPTLPPWILGQVCHRWRQVALSSPPLWSSIRLTLHDSRITADKISGMACQLASQLRRSGNLPLDVIVLASPALSPDDPLLFTICSHSSRWASLELSLDIEDYSNVLRRISSIVKADIPVLQFLSLYLRGLEGQVDNNVIDAFEFAPKLQHFTLIYGAGDPYASVKVPWSQIVRFFGLRNRYDAHSSSYGYLSQMSNITHLSDVIHVCEPGTRIHLPHLRVLSLTQSIGYRGQSPTVLDRIQPGNQFHDMRITSGVPVGSLSNFLIRSGSTLQTLYLDSKCVGDIARILESVPQLVCLSVYNVTEGLLRALTECNASNTMPRSLPRLRSFGLYEALPPDQRALVVKMVSTRMTFTSNALQKLSISKPIVLTAEIREILEAFQTDGLEIDENPTSWIEYF